MADRRYFTPYSYKPGACIGSLLNVPVPVNVSHVDVWSGDGVIRWTTRSGNDHEMKWPDDGDIMPVIIAMRMSC